MWSDPPVCCKIFCYIIISLRSKLWPFSGACIVWLFEYLSTLMLICAQYERVSELERKTVPANSARSSRKGLKDNNNWLLAIVYKFCIPFGTESEISICGGLDSDCTVVNLHRSASIGHWTTRRGIILSALLFILLVLVFLFGFSVKPTVNRPVFRVKMMIFWSPTNRDFSDKGNFRNCKKCQVSELQHNCPIATSGTGKI